MGLVRLFLPHYYFMSPELRSIYSEIRQKNNDCVAGRIIYRIHEMKDSPEMFVQYLYQYSMKSGKLYEEVIRLRDNGNTYARHLSALTINISCCIYSVDDTNYERQRRLNSHPTPTECDHEKADVDINDISPLISSGTKFGKYGSCN